MPDLWLDDGGKIVFIGTEPKSIVDIAAGKLKMSETEYFSFFKKNTLLTAESGEISFEAECFGNPTRKRGSSSSPRLRVGLPFQTVRLICKITRRLF